jgi:hypothetical protein
MPRRHRELREFARLTNRELRRWPIAFAESVGSFEVSAKLGVPTHSEQRHRANFFSDRVPDVFAVLRGLFAHATSSVSRAACSFFRKSAALMSGPMASMHRLCLVLWMPSRRWHELNYAQLFLTPSGRVIDAQDRPLPACRSCVGKASNSLRASALGALLEAPSIIGRNRGKRH